MEENQNPTQQPTPVVSPGTPVSTSPTSSPPPVVKKSAKFSIKAIISLIIFLLLAGGAAAGFVYREPILKLVSNPTPTPTVVISPTPTLNPTADWIIYSNHNVEFKYPKDVKITENTNGKTQNTVYLELGEKRLTFERLAVDNKSKGKEAPYNETAIEQTFNNLSWKVVPPENTSEYCDAGECGKTAPSFYIYKNEYRYSFYYYSDDLRSVVEQILSTFKFTEKVSQLNSPFKKSYKPAEELITTRKIPEEVTKISETNLQQISCSDQFTGYDDETFNSFNSETNENTKLTDSNLLNAKRILNEKYGKQINAISYCVVDNGATFYEYEIWGGGGGGMNVAYIGLLEKSDMQEIAKIPNDGTAYFGCRQVLQLTIDNLLYIKCGGGDGPGGSGSIYKVDLENKTHSLVLYCSYGYGEGNPAPSINCKNQL